MNFQAAPGEFGPSKGGAGPIEILVDQEREFSIVRPRPVADESLEIRVKTRGYERSLSCVLVLVFPSQSQGGGNSVFRLHGLLVKVREPLARADLGQAPEMIPSADDELLPEHNLQFSHCVLERLGPPRAFTIQQRHECDGNSCPMELLSHLESDKTSRAFADQ